LEQSYHSTIKVLSKAEAEAVKMPWRCYIRENALKGLEHTLPIAAPIMSPLISYNNNLCFVCFSSITVFSLNGRHNQVFKESWCMWDFEADYICMVALDLLNENVKASVDTPASLLMDLMYVLI